MKDVKDIPTWALIDLCRGHWHVVLPINAPFITKDMQDWCDEVKKKIIQAYKDELIRRKPYGELK